MNASYNCVTVSRDILQSIRFTVVVVTPWSSQRIIKLVQQSPNRSAVSGKVPMNLRLTWFWVPHHRPQQEFLYRICCHVFANQWSWTTIWLLKISHNTCCIISSEPLLCKEKHIISFPFSELHSCASRAQLVEQPDKARWIIWKPATGLALNLGALNGWQYFSALEPLKNDFCSNRAIAAMYCVFIQEYTITMLHIYIHNIFESHTAYAGSAPGSVSWAFSKFIAETSTRFCWLERQISLVEAHLQVCGLCHSFCKYEIFLEVL